jgi:hypothetical protein
MKKRTSSEEGQDFVFLAPNTMARRMRRKPTIRVCKPSNENARPNMGMQRPEKASQPERKTLTLGPSGFRDRERDSKIISLEGGVNRASASRRDPQAIRTVDGVAM